MAIDDMFSPEELTHARLEAKTANPDCDYDSVLDMLFSSYVHEPNRQWKEDYKRQIEITLDQMHDYGISMHTLTVYAKIFTMGIVQSQKENGDG